ncbi:RNA-binding S4 domain-containing protein [Vibrio vulnificus]|uniref:RNA-binding S4 domain-containing protein n=1 Tax=Vibrio vulnificus TaxID=672 RepID=UPI0009B62408|nr:RNA-binding S4 domain-containing protein [Vibrio vulnificus]EHU4926846.1 RNA-binding S4 domain-containing protein [Vibrio vulnificus]EIT7020402.1 RNA-binding S4 domain-containing protein [Vibrio vulnificus]EIV8619536.1 RNA-binding S4 domain-containing protein [Vibrio vulnificus]EIX4887427.1 RNA-binding S4 domain-containing protein [Vibrio vulnificus]EIZ1408918.1 RNA-binding S4 domain-containing protein [Vibrio vulnificus]
MSQDYELDDEQHGEEIEIEAIGVEVSNQPIELYKVFKIANLVSGGGEAKHAISEGYVAVNGELETRKRRKMYDGDFFEFNQEYYVVVCDAPVTEPETAEQKADKKADKKAQKEAKTARKEKSHQAKQAKTKGTGPKSTGRKTAHKERKAQKEALSQSAKKGQKAEKPQATRDPNSGRNSIDFF